MFRWIKGVCRKAAHRIGRRGFVLIMMGWVFFGAALQAFVPDQPIGDVAREAGRFLFFVMPHEWWGLLFGFAAVWCWLGAWFKRVEVQAFFLCAWLWTLFGVGYTIAIFGSHHPVAIARMAITNFVIAAFVILASTWKEHQKGE